MKLQKNLNNLQIAELLRAVAASYQLKGQDKNRFRITAYQRAADAVEHSTSELKDLWDDGKLKDVPAVGESIASHLDELFRTGKSKHFEEVMQGLPAGMFELMEVPGIGAKTAFKLVTKMGIKNIRELEKAAKAGKIAKLPGFGDQSQVDILKSIQETKGRTRRLLLPYAASRANEVIEWLLKDKNVERADPLGSLRRQAATVGDIDIAAASNYAKDVLNHFIAFPKKIRVLEKGEHTASLILPGDVQVDLMVQPPKAYGSLLQHFTGSKHHNIALREFALKQGMSLSEYGIKIKGKLNKVSSEEDFYKQLGLSWIPPELREDMGEIEAAQKNKLPLLLEVNDIKGDLQIHSNFDIETSHDLGESSIEELTKVANNLGYEYIALTEHNPSRSKHSDEEIINLLKKKKEVIDKINYSLLSNTFSRIIKVFNSLEIDILPNGERAIPDSAMGFLDFALVSIHSSFSLDREQMTKRVLKGLNHPKVKIFAHPTARKLGEREGIELNWSEIFEYCIKKNKYLEINADPGRLDLPDTLVKEAIGKGVKLTLGTDAHHKDGLKNMIFGVSVARRGWAEKTDIINTLSLKEFEKVIQS